MKEQQPEVILTAIGHDPEGTWATPITQGASKINEIYNKDAKVIIFTSKTNQATVKAALDTDWQVVIEDNPQSPINGSRMEALRRGLALGSKGNISHDDIKAKVNDYYLNYWDGDRLFHAALVAPDELKALKTEIPKYDFFIAGASPESLQTHPESMIRWEAEKSRFFGHFLDFKGDIANRGTFGFSRQFANWLLSSSYIETDETDALFTAKALAFNEFLKEAGIKTKGIGYAEYERLTNFENWRYEGLTPEQSREKHNTEEESAKRKQSVKACIETFAKYANLYRIPSKNPLLEATLGK
jgi:hypothetical protein